MNENLINTSVAKSSVTRRHSRKGAAFLILVILVLLVVVGATQGLLRGELTTRRSEVDRLRARSMTAAIEAAEQAMMKSVDPIRLPMDESSDEYVELSINKDKSQITARWVKRDQVIDEMRQTIEKRVESSE